jgi:hypothetical protein
VDVQIDKLPVVEPGPFEVPIIDFEAQWFDQVQRRQRRSAQAGYAPCIGRDFGLE